VTRPSYDRGALEAMIECRSHLGGTKTEIVSLAVKNLRAALRAGKHRDFAVLPVDLSSNPDMTHAESLESERQWIWENGMSDIVSTAYVLERSPRTIRRMLKQGVLKHRGGDPISPYLSLGRVGYCFSPQDIIDIAACFRRNGWYSQSTFDRVILKTQQLLFIQAARQGIVRIGRR
jgi:hypothetical protein